MMLETLCNIAAKPQEWVWNGVIPAGQLTLLIGEPGVGKSMFAMDVIARATRGQRGLSDLEQGEPGQVILFSGEDDLASIVRLRLDSAGADHRFVNVVETDMLPMFETSESNRNWPHDDFEIRSLESDLTALRESGASCRLVVIDPVNWFLDATGSRSDDQVREMMAKLADLAVRSGTAILLVANWSTFERGKRGRLSATTPVLAEAARSVWTIVCDPDEPRRRMLLPIKTNLCETPPGLAFTIQDGRICWEEESVAQSAGQFLAETTEHQRLQHRAAESELSRASEWLKRRLSDGTVYSNELKADAADADFSEKTLRRALILVGCRKGKEKKANGQWYWRLPTSMKGPAPGFAQKVGETEQTSDELGSCIDRPPLAGGRSPVLCEAAAPISSQVANTSLPEASTAPLPQKWDSPLVNCLPASVHHHSEGVSPIFGAKADAVTEPVAEENRDGRRGRSQSPFIAERDPSGQLRESWPTSIAQKPNEIGNLANACEVGQLFCESTAEVL